MDFGSNYPGVWPDIERFFQLTCRRKVFDFKAVAATLQEAIVKGKYPRATRLLDADYFTADICRIHWALAVKHGKLITFSPAQIAPPKRTRTTITPLPSSVTTALTNKNASVATDSTLRRVHNGSAAGSSEADSLGLHDEAIIAAALADLARAKATDPAAAAVTHAPAVSGLALIALRAQALGSSRLVVDESVTAPGSAAASDDDEYSAYDDDNDGDGDGSEGSYYDDNDDDAASTTSTGPSGFLTRNNNKNNKQQQQKRRKQQQRKQRDYNICTSRSITDIIDTTALCFPSPDALGAAGDVNPVFLLLPTISGVDEGGNECKIDSPQSPRSPASPPTAGPATAAAGTAATDGVSGGNGGDGGGDLESFALPPSYVDEGYMFGFTQPREGYTVPAEVRRREGMLHRIINAAAPTPIGNTNTTTATRPSNNNPENNDDDDTDADANTAARSTAAAAAAAGNGRGWTEDELTSRMPFAPAPAPTKQSSTANSAVTAAGAAQFVASSQSLATAVAVLGLLDASQGRFKLKDAERQLNGDGNDDNAATAAPVVRGQSMVIVDEDAAADDDNNNGGDDDDDEEDARLAWELDQQLEREMEEMRAAEAQQTSLLT